MIWNFLTQCYAMYWIQRLAIQTFRSYLNEEFGHHLIKTSSKKFVFTSPLHAERAYIHLLENDLDIDVYFDKGGNTIYYSYTFPGVQKFESELNSHEYLNAENWKRMKRRRLHSLNK
jgi:outer membrane translocation and assembly module TamA